MILEIRVQNFEGDCKKSFHEIVFCNLIGIMENISKYVFERQFGVCYLRLFIIFKIRKETQVKIVVRIFEYNIFNITC